MPPLLVKNWREIGFKWALRHAVDHNFDVLAWTTGTQQAARYSLEKEVREITWRRMEGNERDRAEVRGIGITLVGRGEIMFDVDTAGKVVPGAKDTRAAGWAGAPLDAIIGKELAAQVLGEDVGTISGEGLKVGGEGLKRLYDVDFRNVVNSLPALKKLGVKVELLPVGKQPAHTVAELDAAMDAIHQETTSPVAPLTALPEGYEPIHDANAARTHRWAVLPPGQQHARAWHGWHETREDAIASALARLNDEAAQAERQNRLNRLQHQREQAKHALGLVPGIRITPAVREAVLGGQALFQSAPATPPTRAEALRAWAPRTQVKTRSGAPAVVYTGTTGQFTTFDRTRANIESDLGAGFYFSNNPHDVGFNYAGEGPDLTNRIERKAEQLAQADEDAGGASTPAEIRAAARRALGVEHGGVTMPVYLNLEHPAILGGPHETRLEMQHELDDEGEFVGEPTGTLLEFADALREAAAEFHDGDVENAIAKMLETADYEAITLAGAINVLKDTEGFNYYTDDDGNVASHEIIRLALEGMGFDGIIDHTVNAKFGTERRTGQKMAGMTTATVHYVAFRANQIKSALGNRGTFDPRSSNILEQPEEPPRPPERRGSIRFGADRQFNISLFERADLSTFLHESGHFFLEVMRDLEARPEASPRIRAMMATLREEWTRVGADTNVAQHEHFATAFEKYLMEGEAPSLALRGAFATFRAWLLGIYRSLTRLKVELTPEVRQVFDRLLATDQAIAEASAAGRVQPLFLTAAIAGMSPTEFGLYRAAIVEASRTAKEELDRKLLEEVQREQTAAWRHQRDDLREVVAAEYYAKREYRAIAAMRNGLAPDGSPMVEGLVTPALKLSRAQLVAEFGEGRLAALPAGIYTRAGGMEPRAVAEMFGYGSTDALLTAVSQAPPLEESIDKDTNARMLTEHGNLQEDGELPEAAQRAVANTTRDRIIRLELRALAQLKRIAAPVLKAGQAAAAAAGDEHASELRWKEAEAKLRVAFAEGRSTETINALAAEAKNLRQKARGGPATIEAAVPSEALLLSSARARIAATRVRDLRPGLFWSAARRASAAATAAAARQDFDGAIAAKTQELVNNALYRAAVDAQDDVLARVKEAQAMSRGPARKRIGLAGGSYLEQVDDILDRYSFGSGVSLKSIDRRQTLRRWLAMIEKQGLPTPELPEQTLDDTRRVHYLELPVEELIGVSDALRSISHLATLKNDLLTGDKTRTFLSAKADLTDSIRANNTAHPLPLEFRPGDQKWRSVADAFASHAKLSTIVFQLDGARDGGVMWNMIMRPINAAADDEVNRKKAAGTAYTTILEAHYPGRQLRELNVRLFIPAINGSLSKEGRLAVALNWGNQTSRDRLLADPQRKWTLHQVQAILDTLDQRDWAFVQATWDYVNTFWPEIAAKTRRLTGIAPEKVEAIPVTTKYGDYAGGYYPLQYDPRLNVQAAQHEAAEQAKLTIAGAYMRSTTKRGHLKTRLENVERSVRLEIGVVFQHLEQVIHDLTHHEMLIDVGRLLRDPEVAGAILDTRGDIVYQQFTRALTDIAIGATPAPLNIVDKATTYMRTGTQLSMMGWNLWTALQQPLGVFNGMARVGPVWVARGMTRWLRDAVTMEHTAGWIASVSPMMRARVTNATQDLADVRKALSQPGGWFDGLVRRVSLDTVTQQTILDSYLWHIGIAQRVADIPTWLGQYEKSMAGMGTSADAARAIADADQAVLDSQGGGAVKDLAQVQRGGPAARLFLTFYSYGNTVLNATMRETAQTNFRSPAQVATFLGHLSLIYIAPAIGTVALSRALGKSDGGGDDWVAEFLRDVGRETLSAALNTIVLVRELQGLVQEGTRGYAGPAGARLIETFYKLGQQAKQGELDEGFWKAVNAAAGVLFRYPAAQVQRTVDGWVALEEGRTSNPAVLLTGAPPKQAQRGR
jgi:hypothetical protein